MDAGKFVRTCVALVVFGVWSPTAFADDDDDDDERKGKIKIPFIIDRQAGAEIAVREPSMCEGKASGKIKWDKEDGEVEISAKFKGLPYRPTYCYDDFNGNPSTPWNEYPDCVEDGKWQIWLMAHIMTKTNVFYYDADTGELIANEFDLPNGPPENAIPVELPVSQLMCTDFFESKPHNLKAKVKFTFDYHQMLDPVNSGGVYATALPTDLDHFYDPDFWGPYYTEGGLPQEEAFNMDNVLDEFEAGTSGMILSTSYEPFPKPEYLHARDNLMIGWGGQVPDDAFPPVIPPPEYEECGTYQLVPDFSVFVPPEP